MIRRERWGQRFIARSIIFVLVRREDDCRRVIQYGFLMEMRVLSDVISVEDSTDI